MIDNPPSHEAAREILRRYWRGEVGADEVLAFADAPECGVREGTLFAAGVLAESQLDFLRRLPMDDLDHEGRRITAARRRRLRADLAILNPLSR